MNKHKWKQPSAAVMVFSIWVGVPVNRIFHITPFETSLYAAVLATVGYATLFVLENFRIKRRPLEDLKNVE